MLAGSFSQKSTSIITKTIRSFSSGGPTTVFVLATQQSYDTLGASIMRHIKNQSNEEIQFIGLGGEKMRAEGLGKEYEKIENFEDKPFYPWKNFLAKHINQPIHAAVGHYILNDYKMVKSMIQKSDLLYDIEKAYQPSAYLILGNNHFMYRFNEKLQAYYYQNHKFKPPMFYLDKMIYNASHDQEGFCDHQFYTIPKEPVNWQYYRFPSTFIGFSGVSKALSHLYKRSSQYSELAEGNSLYVSTENFSEVVESMLPEERSRFRREHNIDESHTVFYVSPGNVADEIKFAVPTAKQMIDEFLKHYSNFTASNFEVIIPTEPECQHLIEDAVSKAGFQVKVHFVQGNDRYSAIAASDMGAIISGEAVAEATALQLPSVVLTNMGWYKAYRTLLYNSFNTDLNVTVEGEALPEYLGQQYPQNLVQSWIEWFEDPKKGFDRIHRFDEWFPKFIPKAEGQVQDGVSNQTKRVGNFTFEKYYDGEYLAARKMIDGINVYKELSAKSKYYELHDNQEQVIRILNNEASL